MCTPELHAALHMHRRQAGGGQGRISPGASAVEEFTECKGFHQRAATYCGMASKPSKHVRSPSQKENDHAEHLNESHNYIPQLQVWLDRAYSNICATGGLQTYKVAQHDVFGAAPYIMTQLIYAPPPWQCAARKNLWESHAHQALAEWPMNACCS